MEGELVATSPPLTKDSAEKLDLMPEAPSTLSCRDLNSRGGVDLSSDVLHEPIMIIDFNPSTPTHTSNSRQDPHFNGSSFLEGTAVTVDHGGTSSVFAASFNFVNSIVGAGIIGNRS